MRKKINIKIAIILLLSAPLLSWSQDIHFSQMEFSPLTLNPGLAGANYDLEADINYRNQWSSIASPFQTIDASVYSRLNTKNRHSKKAYFAAGLDFFSDQSGDNKIMTNHIKLTFATQIFMNRHTTIGLGVYGGWQQRAISDGNSTWSNQYDGMHYNPSLPSGENFRNSAFNNFDVGAGLVYTYKIKQSRMAQNDSKKINIGFGAYHLNRPSYSFLNTNGERQYIRFSGFINASFGVPLTLILIEPGIYFNHQGPANELYLGAYVKYIIQKESQYTIFIQPFTASLGLFMRNRDAFVLKALLEWNGIGLGFAYDINTLNSLISASKGKGAFEFALRYVIPDFSRRPYINGGRSFF